MQLDLLQLVVLLAEALLGDEGLGGGFGAEGVGGLQAAEGPVGAGRGRRLELRRGREGRAGDGVVGHRGRGKRGPGVANDEVEDVRAVVCGGRAGCGGDAQDSFQAGLTRVGLRIALVNERGKG